MARACLLSVPGYASGSLSLFGDNWYRITPTVSGQYNFAGTRRMFGIPYNKLHAVLYTSNGRTVFSRSNNQMTVTLVAGQTYYLQVKNPSLIGMFLSRNYTITVTPR